MNPLGPEEFECVLEQACDWASAGENEILQTGIALTEAQSADATRVGVVQPGRVRLRRVRVIENPQFILDIIGAQAAAKVTIWGRAFRYGICLRHDQRNQRKGLVHELVHTMQYERLNGFQGFLRQYFKECLSVGYDHMPLELEANRLADEICGTES
jgi:hypothetical protein